MKEIEFAMVDKAVKEIIHQINAKITDIAFYFDPEEGRYLIIHNFFNQIFSDDDFARKVSNTLYERLDQQGIEHYDFYSDDDMLAQLTMSYETLDPEETLDEMTFYIPATENYSVTIDFDNMVLNKLENNLLLSA
ncbi:hypothetical protein CSV77_13755 [Sporosarcina sp. P16b]|uniref:hypothetical protein n=1 Tax=Sporosarcina sp. P16b TaxID=2048261 RepID=UPI000C1657A9|nr:hypothetical protein [Sporosarcina sp. P16b]PIC69467.1 hypothetical protein CSV77_13755 [Sporosarcina sp. P16b]